jgi:hypothetical protein
MRTRYRTSLLLAALLPLCACGASPPQVAEIRAQAAPEYQKLTMWVGDWTYVCDGKETPLGPAGRATGKASVRVILGGYFVEWRGEEQGPSGAFRWREIDGYDRAAGKYVWSEFSDDGGSNSVTYSIEGTTVRYSGTAVAKDKLVKIRGTAAIASDRKGFVDAREVSATGETWMPAYECRFTKVGGAGK